MLCPKCGEEVTGNYCCFCGAFLEPSQTADSTKTTASSRPYTSEKAYSKSSEIKKDTDMPDHEIIYETFTTQVTEKKKSSGARKKSSASSGKATKKSASTPSRQTVKQKNKVKKKKKRNVLSTAGSLTTGSVRSVWKLFILAAQWLCSGAMLLSSFFLFKGFWISRNALGSISVTTGSVRSVWKLFILAAQWLCSGAMLLSSFFLFKGFWISRNALGSISGIVKEHNYAQGIFLAGALCIVGFGLLQTLWLLSRKKMPDQGKIRRIDMGRGFFGFLVFILLYLAAGYLNPLIPSSPAPLTGIKQIFTVIAGLGTSFFMLNLLGVILCIIRKIGTR